MSVRSAQCPSCGAEIEFRSAASVFVVCPHCSHASARSDAKLELVGKVAEVAPIESPIALRATGDLEGRKFTVVGQLQLDHGAGPWNEWAIAFEDGSNAWVAEAQGQILVTIEIDVPLARIASWSKIGAGDEIDFGDRGRWIVAEKGVGVVTAARGELFTRLQPGSVVQYADLSGIANGFGTLDYQAGEACEAVYLGRRYELADLALDTTGSEMAVQRRVRAKKLDCPSCQGAIDLRDQDGVKRIGCPYCGALLDPTSETVRVVEAAQEFKRRPTIPIGASGTFKGATYEVIAFLERSVTSEGVRYPWDEYLLRRTDGAYRWLVASNGHWSFVEPLNLADVKVSGTRARYDGTSFRRFSRGKARVDVVLGEVYWEVKAGETVKSTDYVAPPRMVSFEEADDEKNVSLGTYLTPDEVSKAFALTAKLAAPRGVGAQQPNGAVAGAKSLWKSFALLALLVTLLNVAFHVAASNRAVLSQEFPAAFDAKTGALVSDEFEIARGNALVSIVATGLHEGRFTVDGTFVDVETQATHDFWVRSSGTSDASLPDTLGGAKVLVGGLSSGRYVLRLVPRSSAIAAAPKFQVTVTNQIASSGRPWIVILILLAPPIVASLVAAAMESARWQQSDEA